MIECSQIDNELRKIPIGTTSSVFGIRVSKVPGPQPVSHKMSPHLNAWRYAVEGTDKPLRATAAVHAILKRINKQESDDLPSEH